MSFAHSSSARAFATIPVLYRRTRLQHAGQFSVTRQKPACSWLPRKAALTLTTSCAVPPVCASFLLNQTANVCQRYIKSAIPPLAPIKPLSLRARRKRFLSSARNSSATVRKPCLMTASVKRLWMQTIVTPETAFAFSLLPSARLRRRQVFLRDLAPIRRSLSSRI